MHDDPMIGAERQKEELRVRGLSGLRITEPSCGGEHSEVLASGKTHEPERSAAAFRQQKDGAPSTHRPQADFLGLAAWREALGEQQAPLTALTVNVAQNRVAGLEERKMCVRKTCGVASRP
ncbi:hypothetical protein MTO96_014567 [Rhipicephalus appendiculatus]